MDACNVEIQDDIGVTESRRICDRHRVVIVITPSHTLTKMALGLSRSAVNDARK
jgi:hypothetical protein